MLACMDQLSPVNTELRALDALVGKWFSEGEVEETSENPRLEVKGTDSYEWVCNGSYLLHRVDVVMGAEKKEVVELIGYDVQNAAYSMRSFDNQGNFTLMYMTITSDGIYKINGDLMRSTLIVSKDGKDMTAQWEKSSDGTIWEVWMDMKFTKAL